MIYFQVVIVRPFARIDFVKFIALNIFVSKCLPYVVSLFGLQHITYACFCLRKLKVIHFDQK